MRAPSPRGASAWATSVLPSACSTSIPPIRLFHVNRSSFTMATNVQARPSITRLAGRLGAVVSDVEVTHAGDETIADIRRALLEHRVVFLRDQQLDYDSLV